MAHPTSASTLIPFIQPALDCQSGFSEGHTWFWAKTTTKQLPKECLDIIFRHVDDIGTYFNLLTVSKTVFHIVVRYLYRFAWFTPGPFSYKPVQSLPLVYRILVWALQEAEDAATTPVTAQSSPCLDETLLLVKEVIHSLVVVDEPDLLLQELVKHTAKTKKPYADYLSMMRVLDFSAHPSSDRPLLEDTLLQYCDLNIEFQIRCSLSPRQATIAINHAAFWAILHNEKRANNIERLRIPVQYIKLYMKAIPSLINLAHVKFDVNEAAYLPTSLRPYYVMALDFLQCLEAARGGRGHGRPLQSVGMVGTYFQSAQDRKLCEPLHRELFRYAAKLERPTTIDGTNWTSFIMDAGNMSFERVESIDQNIFKGHAWSDLQHSWPNMSAAFILQQCRALKRLTATFDVPAPFEWAVEEKRQAFRTLNDDHLSIQFSSTASSFPRLVNLEELSMFCDMPLLETATNDALVAFSHSLRQLIVQRRMMPFEPSLSNPVTVRLGGGGGASSYHLPKLERLHISSYYAVAMDSSALQHAPLLKWLHLEGNQPSPDESLSLAHLGGPWSLPSLTNLTLLGYSALVFHPGTLSTTSKLDSLVLVGNLESVFQNTAPGAGFAIVNRMIMPKPGPVLSQIDGLWTWNWYLPALRYIRLTGIHAARFRFNALLHMPLVEELHLDIGNHRRRLDTGRPSSGDTNCEKEDSQRPQACKQGTKRNDKAELLTTPTPTSSIAVLTIQGRFLFSDADLVYLLKTWCPRLFSLTVLKAGGFSTATLVETGMQCPRLAIVSLSRALNTKESRALQLHSPTNSLEQVEMNATISRLTSLPYHMQPDAKNEVTHQPLCLFVTKYGNYSRSRALDPS